MTMDIVSGRPYGFSVNPLSIIKDKYIIFELK